MMKRDVAPKHQAPVIRPENFAHAIEVFEVDSADTFCLSLLFAPAFTKFKRFIRANMKERSGKEIV